MTNQKTVAQSNEPTQWQRPQVLRLEAGKAEIGTSNKTDGLNTAS